SDEPAEQRRDLAVASRLAVREDGETLGSMQGGSTSVTPNIKHVARATRVALSFRSTHGGEAIDVVAQESLPRPPEIGIDVSSLAYRGPCACGTGDLRVQDLTSRRHAGGRAEALDFVGRRGREEKRILQRTATDPLKRMHGHDRVGSLRIHRDA